MRADPERGAEDVASNETHWGDAAQATSRLPSSFEFEQHSNICNLVPSRSIRQWGFAAGSKGGRDGRAGCARGDLLLRGPRRTFRYGRQTCRGAVASTFAI